MLALFCIFPLIFLFPPPTPLPYDLIGEERPVIGSLSPLVAQTVKRLPTVREIRVQSLGQEDLLEKAMAPHSSPLSWKIPLMEEPGRL